MRITGVEELLIVISVVAMLTALMFPLTCWLVTVNDCVNQARCHRQAARVVLLYSDDSLDNSRRLYHQEHTPPARRHPPADRISRADADKMSRVPVY